jgi:hypothetical protein
MAVAVGDAKGLLGDGLTPLAYLLLVMRDEQHDVETRIEAARAAAPYCHRKRPTDIVVDDSRAERMAIIPNVTLRGVG